MARTASDLRSKRKGLNPRKVIFIYLAAFLLIAFHQSGRVAEWFDDQGAKSEGLWSEISFSIAAFINEKIEPHGPARMNQAENELLDKVPDIIVGGQGEQPARRPGVEPPPPAPPLAVEIEPVPALEEMATAAHEPEAEIEAIAIAPPEGTETPPPDEDVQPEKTLEAMEEPEIETAPVAEEAVAAETFAPEGAGADSEESAEAALTAFNPSSVLLLGDSMMLEGVGPPLERRLKKNEGLTVNRTGRYGTGLCRLDVFDWLTYFKENLAKYKPDLIIITLGANDPQDIVNAEGRKKRIHLGTDEWNELYGDRVTELLSMAENSGTDVLWMGLPIMGREPYGSRVAAINQVVAEACAAKSNCRFWDAWLSVADDNGRYAVQGRDSEGKSVRIRAKDSIHLTEKGGEIMADKFLEETADWVEYEQEAIEEASEAPPADEASTAAPSAGDGDEAYAAPVGVVTEYTLLSAVRGKETAYFVAAPAGAGAEPLPAVFLLHGAWDGHNAWVKNVGRGKLASLAQAHNIIIIMPDGEPFGWYLDGPDCAIESYFMGEMMPHVLESHPVDKNRLAISGLSMGGHGALTLAMKYPGVFKAVTSMSGVMDLTAHGDGRALSQSLNIHKVLGPFAENSEKWLKSCARGLTEADPERLRNLSLLITVGLADSLTIEENRRYHQLLEQLNIAHEYREAQGGHTWKYWSAQLPAHLDFLARHLREM
ncbi:hypothetical protein C4J81_11140 [Deltaproteobacteria bacterium Smac51]|nr:hypothetical protein C4J81_11140 [Deltaproteobacteria bacterium Smac51]